MVLQATPTSMNGKPQVSFRKDEFDALIWKHGYKIRVEKAHRCPCEGIDGTPKFSCQNCQGTGFFWIDPIETIGLITGINKNTEYKDWSVELIGTISLSIRDLGTNDEEKVSFYDKVTLLQRSASQVKPFAYHTEILKVRDDGTGNKYVFTTYKVQSVLSMFKFVAVDEKLQRVTDFTVSTTNPYVIDLGNSVYCEDEVISIRYKADIQYTVLDLPHEVRHTTKNGKGNRFDTQTMPIQAVCRRVHLTQADRKNYDGTGILDNTL